MIIEGGALLFGHETIKKIVEALTTTVGTKAAEHVGTKLPLFLGLSTADESRWAAIWSKLTDGEQKKITDFLFGLRDYERNHFRYVAVGMIEEEEKTITGTGKDRKETVARKSTALAFLRDLAKVIENHGLGEARRRCEAGNIMGNNPLVQQAMAMWHESCAWFKTNVLVPLEAVDLADMTNKVIALINTGAKKTADAIAVNIIDPIAGRVKHSNKSWWRRLLW